MRPNQRGLSLFHTLGGKKPTGGGNTETVKAGPCQLLACGNREHTGSAMCRADSAAQWRSYAQGGNRRVYLLRVLPDASIRPRCNTGTADI